MPETTDGRILGHEAVGIVEAVGTAVKTIRPGDRVLVSCISSCGRCRYCRGGSYGQCLGGGGWILGHLIDGTQAQFVRTPFAERSLYKLPDSVLLFSLAATLAPARRAAGIRPAIAVRVAD